MSLTLKQIEAFVCVADHRSFRRAAERLNTTQPNISARIAALEATLGGAVMTRDAGSVQLTPKGYALLDPARAVLRGVDTMIGAFGDARLIKGVLRLGVTELVVHTWLGAFLGALKEKYPEVLVELTVDLSANLSAALFDRTLDLTFQNGPFARQTSGNIAIRAYPFVWVAAPGLGMNAAAPAKLQDLLTHPILTHARGTLAYDQLAAHLAAPRSGLHPQLVPSSNLAACLQMAIDGYGLACLPYEMAAQPLSNGALVQVNYEWAPAPLEFLARFDARSGRAFVPDAARLANVIAMGPTANDKNS